MTFIKKTLSVPEASDLMNVHANTVFKMIDAGTLPAAKIGRAYVLLLDDVMNYIEQMVIKQTSARMMGSPIRPNGRSPHLLGKVRAA